MRVAVAGATGRIGHRVMAALARGGNEPVAISRSQGVDLLSGDGVDEALAGAHGVIDVTNTAATDPDAVVDFFRTATGNLLAAAGRAGARHYLLLSIVGVHRVRDNAHYAGKRAQEELVERSALPSTIVSATQFFDFPLMIASRSRREDTAFLPPLLMQPIAPGDVAEVLAELVVAEPAGRLELAGPQPEDLIDMARRSFAARGDPVRLVPTWDGRYGVSMAGKVLLPGPQARIAPTTFEEWLAAGQL